MGDDEAESTLLQIRECFVYKIPPRQTNAGYKFETQSQSRPLKVILSLLLLTRFAYLLRSCLFWLLPMDFGLVASFETKIDNFAEPPTGTSHSLCGLVAAQLPPKAIRAL